MRTAAQPEPLVLDPIPARRGRRRLSTYIPPRKDGRFRPPQELVDQIAGQLEGRGNREACWRLLTFLMASYGGRLLGVHFYVDRRAVAAKSCVQLTEDQVRGALRTLLEIGVIMRLVPVGEGGWRETPEGRRRKAVAYTFSAGIYDMLKERRDRARQMAGRRRGGSRPGSFRPSKSPKPPLREIIKEARGVSSEPSANLNRGEWFSALPKAFPSQAPKASRSEILSWQAQADREAKEARVAQILDPNRPLRISTPGLLAKTRAELKR